MGSSLQTPSPPSEQPPVKPHERSPPKHHGSSRDELVRAGFRQNALGIDGVTVLLQVERRGERAPRGARVARVARAGPRGHRVSISHRGDCRP